MSLAQRLYCLFPIKLTKVAGAPSDRRENFVTMFLINVVKNSTLDF